MIDKNLNNITKWEYRDNVILILGNNCIDLNDDTMKFDLSSYYNTSNPLYVSDVFRDYIDKVRTYFNINNIGFYSTVDEFIVN